MQPASKTAEVRFCTLRTYVCLRSFSQAASAAHTFVSLFPNHAEPHSYFSNAYMLFQVAEMKVKLAELSDVRKAHLTRQADRMATEFEAQRELDSVCLVVDMDMFYAAVEIRSGSPPAKAPGV